MIVGLGNPGSEYTGTRHNVGFEFLDLLAKKHQVKIKTFKHKAAFGIGIIEKKPVLLVKPMTYMNLSGQAVAPFAKEFGISPAKILVTADDMDLEFGKIRIRAEGSAGGHNGHKSIIKALGTTAYPRLRIGIGRVQEDVVNHVLSCFNPHEMEVLNRVLERCMEACKMFLKEDIATAMNHMNQKNAAES